MIHGKTDVALPQCTNFFGRGNRCFSKYSCKSLRRPTRFGLGKRMCSSKRSTMAVSSVSAPHSPCQARTALHLCEHITWQVGCHDQHEVALLRACVVQQSRDLGSRCEGNDAYQSLHQWKRPHSQKSGSVVSVPFPFALTALRMFSLWSFSRRLRKASASSMNRMSPRGLFLAHLKMLWISVTASFPKGPCWEGRVWFGWLAEYNVRGCTYTERDALYSVMHNGALPPPTTHK